MALYLVVHTPKSGAEEAVMPPSDLEGLARASLLGRGPRWLRTWSPGLQDDRVFTMWEAENAAEVEALIERFHFMEEFDARPLRVKEWGPDDVLASLIDQA
jgi:hypothetical protein